MCTSPTSPRYAFTGITVVPMSVLCLFPLKYDATTLLFCVHAVSVFLKIMMTMYQQFSRLWYVCPYGLGLVLHCCRKAAFPNYQIVHGLAPPLLSHPDSLECWYLRHETTLSIIAQGNQAWGISGRYSVAEDATCMGLA